jgi:hypothetical protein
MKERRKDEPLDMHPWAFLSASKRKSLAGGSRDSGFSIPLS